MTTTDTTDPTDTDHDTTEPTAADPIEVRRHGIYIDGLPVLPVMPALRPGRIPREPSDMKREPVRRLLDGLAALDITDGYIDAAEALYAEHRRLIAAARNPTPAHDDATAARNIGHRIARRDHLNDNAEELLANLPNAADAEQKRRQLTAIALRTAANDTWRQCAALLAANYDTTLEHLRHALADTIDRAALQLGRRPVDPWLTDRYELIHATHTDHGGWGRPVTDTGSVFVGNDPWRFRNPLAVHYFRLDEAERRLAKNETGIGIQRRGEWRTADDTAIVIYDAPVGITVTLYDIVRNRDEWAPDVVPLPDALTNLAAIGIAQGTTRR